MGVSVQRPAVASASFNFRPALDPLMSGDHTLPNYDLSARSAVRHSGSQNSENVHARAIDQGTKRRAGHASARAFFSFVGDYEFASKADLSC